jgi:hypothetical protein
LEDVVTLVVTEKVRMPWTCLQVSITLDAYRVILHTCLGEAHQLTIEFDAFMASWKARATQFHQGRNHFGKSLFYLFSRFFL